MNAEAPAAAPLTLSLFGDGPDAIAWARALRGVEGVSVRRVTPDAEHGLEDALSGAASAALVLAGPVPDVGALIKRAVMAGRHVLVAGTPPLASKQLLAIGAAAGRRGRVVVFDVPGLADESVAFVRKATGGSQALWRPRYIRSIRTGDDGTRRSLDEIALGELALVLALAGGLPQRVSAVAPRLDDETGAGGVAMLTLMFDGGRVVRIDVSMVEPELRAETSVVCDGRTLVLDAYDTRAPLRIHATARHRGPRHGGQWGESVSEHPLAAVTDRTARVAEMFVAAVRGRDAGITNVRDIAEAALVWETARASIAQAGEAVPLSGGVQDVRRPELQVIRGRGRGTGAGPAPELTLVQRTPDADIPPATA